MRRFWLPLALVLITTLLLASAPAEVHAEEGATLSVGPTIGLNRSILSAPDDAAGEPVFMSGSAFNGFGGGGGVTARYLFMPFLGVEADLAISVDRALGFEERAEMRRELTLSAMRLRIPVSLIGAWQSESIRFQGGVGFELALPLSAEGEVSEENVPAGENLEIEVDGAFGVGAAFSLGAAFKATESMWIPVSMRASWFPGVASTSSERFDGFVSATQPGTFEIAYDWTLFWSAGVLFDVM